MTSSTLSPTTSQAQRVTSSAIYSLQILLAEGSWTLQVAYNSNHDKVYTFEFKNAAIVWEWTKLLADDRLGELSPEFSWGKHLHKAIRNGDLIVPTVW